MLKQTYAYDDVTLIPQYSELKSRSQANPQMKGYYLPIIASCMDTLGKETMMEMITNNIPFIANRAFKSAQEQFNYFLGDLIKENEVRGTNGITILINNHYILKNIWFAVGSVQKYKDWIDYLYNMGIRQFCVDMAHGDSKACIDTIKYIKSLKNDNCKYNLLGQNLHVIAGNVATADGFKRLEKAGADGIRIGVASGSICFSGDTKVLIYDQGKVYLKPISSIKKGDYVISASGKVRKVTKKYVNDYTGEMYKIDDDILATPTHKFNVYDNQILKQSLIPIKDFDFEKYSFLNVEWKTVKCTIDIVEDYDDKVYNIEVEEDHTYCVGQKFLGVSNCSTAKNTGFGVPILTNIIDCYNARKNRNTWIIADGGIKYTGDIAKAVYFGAHFCMIGKMLASTNTALGKCYNKDGQYIAETDIRFSCEEPIFLRPIYPHEFEEMYKLAQKFDWEKQDKESTRKNLVKNNLVAYKEYHGMASRDARKNLLSYASIQGQSGVIEYTKTTRQFIYDTYLNLQASLSYGGSKDWYEFRRKVEACFRSNAGIIAAQTHLDKTFDK